MGGPAASVARVSRFFEGAETLVDFGSGDALCFIFVVEMFCACWHSRRSSVRSSESEGVVWNFCATLWNVSSWRGGQGSGAKARNAMDHPPARDLVAALLHFVSHRASFASFGGGISI